MYSVSAWEIGEYVSCAFVIVGVCGEYIAEFTNLWSAGDEDKKRRIGRFSTLLLAVALVIELVCLVQTTNRSREETAKLNKEAADARKTAAEAIERAGELYVQLGQEHSFRLLEPDQQDRIREKIGKFAGTSFDLAVEPANETLRFMQVIDRLLRSAGWKWNPARSGITITPSVARIVYIADDFQGMRIQVSRPSPRVKDAATALVEALGAEGISVIQQFGQFANEPPDAEPNRMHVIIGKKL